MDLTSEQIRQDAANCDARKVEQARRMSPREKFFAGAELFDDACQVTLAGLRAQYPTFSSQDLRKELKRLLEMTEKMGR
ncbi:hypothetical protein [Roseibacillus ishigakijimensis]|uniref:Uncharacterized protein n=1 Tax=Roseibacillus ishigakijimensis TaxID=454146 RepID=A0A934RQ62_9BACT|nr:hypothetical protein [Roseibacillus ishigakijimensis]MBK1834940.1 hypothetical protein [Roseibacillus ishigakijimensis]